MLGDTVTAIETIVIHSCMIFASSNANGSGGRKQKNKKCRYLREKNEREE